MEALENLILPPTSVDNQQAAFQMCHDIVDNLDEAALKELCSGTLDDMDKVFAQIVEEAYSLITSRGEVSKIKTSSFFYLDSLTNSVDESFSYEDINYFIATHLPSFELDWHTIEWGNFTMWYRNFVIEAARGRGKSFFFSHVYPIWKVFCYEKESNTKRINKKRSLCREGCMITASKSLAVGFLDSIYTTIEDSPVLKDKLMRPNRQGWKIESAKFKNGSNIILKGFDSELRGLHPTWMVCDDILSENQLYSKDAREKAKSKFYGTLRKMVLEGQTVVAGTPFFEDDLYADLETKKQWKVFKYPGIFPNGEVLAPRRFDFTVIQDEIEELGSLFFSREILCKPLSGAATIFPYHILSKSFRNMEEEVLLKNLHGYKRRLVKKVLGCDFAISATTGADYSVFISLGIDQYGDYYLLNIWREKGKSFAEQIAKIKSLHREFDYDVIICESNQMQMIFPQELDKDGLPVYAHNTGEEKNDYKKGLPSLAVLFEHGRIKFPRGDQYSEDMTDLICSELASIAYTDKGIQGVGSHDDCAMSLWLAILAARYKDFNFGFV